MPHRILTFLALLLLMPGCSGIRFRSPIVQRSEERRTGPAQLTAAAIQSELMSFTDTLNGAVAQAWNEVAEAGRAESQPQGLAGPNEDHASRLRRAALANKLATVSASLSIASSPNPNVALADMITMITLQRMVLEGKPAATLYGEDRVQKLVAVYREHEDKVWTIAQKAMDPDHQDELRYLISEWRAGHPDATYVANVRLEDFADLRQQTFVRPSQSSGSLLSLLALDPLAGLDPAQREVEKSRLLGERIFFYASRSPQVLKWQVESLYQDFLRTPEAKKALTSADNATMAAARISKIAEDLPRTLAAEREAAVTQIFQKLGEERHAAIEDAVAHLDKEQGNLKDTLKDYREAIDTTQKAAATLTETIKAADSLAAKFAPDPGAPKKDALAEFKAAATETANAADRLNTLTQNLDKLLGPANTSAPGKIQTAAADLQLASTNAIDHAFTKLLILAIITPFGVAAAMLVYRAITRRWAR